LRHFVKSEWGGDVEEEDLETWIEEVKLIKSLECKRCGIIICVCQQELEFDMDEMPSSSIFSYGAVQLRL
ncbi:hypothetical protein Tco_0076801, partial [Tanacetum coccineum]